MCEDTYALSENVELMYGDVDRNEGLLYSVIDGGVK